MDSNFSTKVGKAICILGVIGGLICGKVFEITTIHGISYTYTKTSYNWSLAIGSMVGSLILGALFISLGQIHETLTEIKGGMNG